MANQKSTKGMVLEWMVEHPNLCKNTSAMGIGKSLELAGIPGTQGTFAHIICKMVNTQMLFKHGNNRRATFMVNYMHRDVPGYVLEKMPEDARRARAALELELNKNQHLNDVGCVVTEPEPEPEPEPEEPVEKPYEEMREYAATAERVEEEPEPEVEPEVVTPTEHAPILSFENEVKQTPAQMEVKQDGQDIKLTLTLNININR